MKILRAPRTYENPLCAEVSPVFFFIDDADDDTALIKEVSKTYDEAAQVCAKCEHITECAEWGVRHEIHGFWGGLSPEKRRELRRIRNITVEDPL